MGNGSGDFCASGVGVAAMGFSTRLSTFEFLLPQPGRLSRDKTAMNMDSEGKEVVRLIDWDLIAGVKTGETQNYVVSPVKYYRKKATEFAGT
ncbi:MAG TPA: hypothetical protein VGP65_02430 [Candidatus Angelobacter sp.]|nr:hypothetical protein [Candidatus Angelobacter sp.]